jgi:hypothetical protein
VRRTVESIANGLLSAQDNSIVDFGRRILGSNVVVRSLMALVPPMTDLEVPECLGSLATAAFRTSLEMVGKGIEASGCIHVSEAAICFRVFAARVCGFVLL